MTAVWAATVESTRARTLRRIRTAAQGRGQSRQEGRHRTTVGACHHARSQERQIECGRMKETTNGLLDAEGTCEHGSAEADQVHSSHT